MNKGELSLYCDTTFGRIVAGQTEGFSWGKAHINLKQFIGDGEMDERGTSVSSLQSLFDTPKNNSDRPSREA